MHSYTSYTRLRATWEYENIELYRLPPDAIMNAGAVGLLPLLPFTGEATVGLIETATHRMKDETRARPQSGAGEAS